MTPISKELEAIINKEAADYSAFQYGDPAKMQGLREIAAFDNGVEDYTAGATAYAHYKERFEQAKKVLEECSRWIRNDQHHPDPEWRMKSAVLRDKVAALLASWKDEGKEEGV